MDGYQGRSNKGVLLTMPAFPIEMIRISMDFIANPALRVLWNGFPSRGFQPSRGIGQGDPQSPYIFVLCMERLAHLIWDSGEWHPVYLRSRAPTLSQLFFADDLVLFSECSLQQVLVIRNYLNKFCLALGEKVSPGKTKIYFSKNVSLHLAQVVSSAGGFEKLSPLGKYLGVPVLQERVTKATYQYIFDKVSQ